MKTCIEVYFNQWKILGTIANIYTVDFGDAPYFAQINIERITGCMYVYFIPK